MTDNLIILYLVKFQDQKHKETESTGQIFKKKKPNTSDLNSLLNSYYPLINLSKSKTNLNQTRPGTQSTLKTSYATLSKISANDLIWPSSGSLKPPHADLVQGSAELFLADKFNSSPLLIKPFAGSLKTSTETMMTTQEPFKTKTL